MGQRKVVLILAAAFLLGTASVTVQGAERKPNIVLIYADDLGWGDVGFNGRREWATPNLDALASRGTRFTRFYTAAVVCAPSRAAMLTGKYTIHNGVSRNNDDLPSSEVTIAEALKREGYTTALFGKWHHGKPRTAAASEKSKKHTGATSYVHPMDQGFDEFFGFTDATHAWEKFPESLWNGRQRVSVTGYADDLFTAHAVDFLKRNRDRSFFLYVPFIATHFHVEAPEEEIALHRGKLPEKDPAEPVNATYAALVTRLDKSVGRIIRTIDELGLSDNTLVVFTSDHGATFEQGNRGASNALDSNHPFRGQKRTLWEGGVRVPALVCWPGHVPAGRVSCEVMHMTDLFPTLLAAAGAVPDPAWKVDGLDVLPAWTGKSAVPARTLFWEWRSEGLDQLAALRGDLKLVITRGGRAELYDVVKDPAERRDLAPQYPDVVQDLNAALQSWLKTEVQP